MKFRDSLTSVEQRLGMLEARVRPTPRPAPPEKFPISGLSVEDIIRTGRQFIGWAWYPTAEEVQAIQGGAMVCFTEVDSGAAFVSVQGLDPRPLPSFREEGQTGGLSVEGVAAGIPGE